MYAICVVFTRQAKEIMNQKNRKEIGAAEKVVALVRLPSVSAYFPARTRNDYVIEGTVLV